MLLFISSYIVFEKKYNDFERAALLWGYKSCSFGNFEKDKCIFFRERPWMFSRAFNYHAQQVATFKSGCLKLLVICSECNLTVVTIEGKVLQDMVSYMLSITYFTRHPFRVILNTKTDVATLVFHASECVRSLQPDSGIHFSIYIQYSSLCQYLMISF